MYIAIWAKRESVHKILIRRPKEGEIQGRERRGERGRKGQLFIINYN